MTNEELKVAANIVEMVRELARKDESELLQLKEGTHPDMVMVPRGSCIEAMEDAFRSVYGIPISAAFRQHDNTVIANAFIQGWKNAMLCAAQKGNALIIDKINRKMPDDLHFDQSVSWFIGQFEGDEDELWKRVDVINNYAKDYKKLYWDLLSSWAELKTKYGALVERLDEQFDKEATSRMLRCLLSEEDTSENMAIQDKFINKTIAAMFERFKVVRKDINEQQ